MFSVGSVCSRTRCALFESYSVAYSVSLAPLTLALCLSVSSSLCLARCNLHQGARERSRSYVCSCMLNAVGLVVGSWCAGGGSGSAYAMAPLVAPQRSSNVIHRSARALLHAACVSVARARARAWRRRGAGGQPAAVAQSVACTQPLRYAAERISVGGDPTGPEWRPTVSAK